MAFAFRMHKPTFYVRVLVKQATSRDVRVGFVESLG